MVFTLDKCCILSYVIMCNNKGLNMNWKRFINASVITIGTAAVIFLCVRTCQDENIRDEIRDTHAQIQDAQKAINDARNENKALRDSIAMWRDSTDAMTKKWQDCEKSKRKPAPTRPAPTRPAPARPAPSADRKPDVKPVVTTTAPVAAKDDINVTKIKMDADTRNNENIVVQNGKTSGSHTEITLGNGAVNDGNIIVNNGGSVKVDGADKKAVDSLLVKLAILEAATDSLKNAESAKKSASASSVVIVRKVKKYNVR